LSFDIQSFRNQLYSEVEVAGIKFKIRKVTVRSLSMLTGELTSGSEVKMEQFIPVMERVLCDCVVEPKILSQGTDEAIGVNELPADIAIQLFYEILKFSGLAPEQVEELRKFRPE